MLLDLLAKSAQHHVFDCFCILLESADALQLSPDVSKRIWLTWSLRHSDRYTQILIFVERLLVMEQQQQQHSLSSPTSPMSMTSPQIDSVRSPIVGLSHLNSQTAMIDHLKPLLSQFYFQMSTLIRVPS